MSAPEGLGIEAGLMKAVDGGLAIQSKDIWKLCTPTNVWSNSLNAAPFLSGSTKGLIVSLVPVSSNISNYFDFTHLGSAAFHAAQITPLVKVSVYFSLPQN